jgi:hypothetical protein
VLSIPIINGSSFVYASHEVNHFSFVAWLGHSLCHLSPAFFWRAQIAMERYNMADMRIELWGSNRSGKGVSASDIQFYPPTFTDNHMLGLGNEIE